MTSAIGSSGFQAGLFERLFHRADRDESGTIGVEELAALLPTESAGSVAQQIVAGNDVDGDGSLTLAEFTGAKFAPETMASLLTAQEYKAATHSERRADDLAAIDDFFSRADVNNDGKLSRAEFDAERILRLAGTLDAGEQGPDMMFLTKREAMDDGTISKEEILVGRRLSRVADAVSLDDPNFDPELREHLMAIRTRIYPPDRDRDDGAAPQPDITAVFGDTVRKAELTDALISRLLRQLELGLGQSG